MLRDDQEGRGGRRGAGRDLQHHRPVLRDGGRGAKEQLAELGAQAQRAVARLADDGASHRHGARHFSQALRQALERDLASRLGRRL
jgi:hypothetical protein